MVHPTQGPIIWKFFYMNYMIHRRTFLSIHVFLQVSLMKKVSYATLSAARGSKNARILSTTCPVVGRTDIRKTRDKVNVYFDTFYFISCSKLCLSVKVPHVINQLTFDLNLASVQLREYTRGRYYLTQTVTRR